MVYSVSTLAFGLRDLSMLPPTVLKFSCHDLNFEINTYKTLQCNRK